jgi:hypothetical protein
MSGSGAEGHTRPSARPLSWPAAHTVRQRSLACEARDPAQTPIVGRGVMAAGETNRVALSPGSPAVAQRRHSATTRASGRTSTRRSASAPRSRSGASAADCPTQQLCPAPSEEAAGARVRRSLHQTVFRRCSATGPSTPQPGRRRVRISGNFAKALYRTRTDDPFLTISRREIPADSESRPLQEIRWCTRFSDAAGFRWRVVL